MIQLALKAYVALVSAAGLLLLAADLTAVPSWHAPWSPPIGVALLVLAVSAYRLIVAVRRGVLLSASSIPLVAGAFLLPPGLAELLAAIAPLGWAITRRVPLHKTVFNVSNSALALGLAIHGASLLVPLDSLATGAMVGLLAGIAVTVLHSTFGVGAVLFVVALEHRRRPWDILTGPVLLQLAAEAALGLIGALLAALLLLMPVWAPVLALPAAFVYLGQRALGRAERRAQTLVLASRVGRAVAASPAPEIAFEAIAAADIREALRANGIALVPLGSPPAFEVFVPSGVADLAPLRDALARQVALTGEPVQFESDETLPTAWLQPTIRALGMTAAALPFRTPDQQLLGAVIVWRPVARSFQSWSRSSFTRDEWLLLETLADYAAVVVENARLRHEAGDAELMRELTRLKDEFLGQVSHELRTPLTIIHAYTELIAEQRVTIPSEIRRAAREAHESSTLMAQLVDDLLDTSRLDSGRLSLNLEISDVAPWLRRACQTFAQANPGRELESEIPFTLPAVRVDLTRLGQVLHNLLTNALRYSPPDTVIRVAAGVTADDQAIEIRVQDFGPGIPKAEQARIFEKFYRGQSGTTQTARGAGLGLSVARALVEAHHGSIGVDSAPGCGSSFWVRIPTDAAWEQGDAA